MEILDDKDNNEALYSSSVSWWEKWRALYNFLVIGLQLILLAGHYEVLLRFGIVEAISWATAYTIVANLFYCIGWGLEVLSIHYHFSIKLLKTIRPLSLLVGLLFSLALTYLLYTSALA